MGTDKLIADLCGKPVLGHVLDAFAAAEIATLCVVGEGAGDAASLAEARGVPLVVARDHALGVAHSLRAALEACPSDWEAVIIGLGDMPLVTPALLTAIAGTAGRDAIVIPVVDGQRGNPVAWGREFFLALCGLSGDRGGRSLFPRFAESIRAMTWHDLQEIRLDVDDPETLQVAQAVIQRRARQRSEQYST